MSTLFFALALLHMSTLLYKENACSQLDRVILMIAWKEQS